MLACTFACVVHTASGLPLFAPDMVSWQVFMVDHIDIDMAGLAY